jgi:hypothetical protein
MAGKTKTKTTQRKAEPASNSRTVALGLGAIGAVAAVAFGLFRLGKRSTTIPGGHVPTDLMGDAHPGPDDRAVDAFRPDPTAPIPDSERDAFRPALVGAAPPTLATPS